MAFNIGLNIVEVDGVGTPAIVGASTSVGAFNITTQRGIPNTPVSVTSFPKFVERFGSYFPNGLGAYLVKGFFDNGGQTAYINRVVASDASSGARPASITLKNSAGTDILTLRAGYRGVDDPGTWGGDLYATIARRPEARLRETTPATVRGTALSAPVDLTGLPPLRVNVDKQPLEVTFKEDDFPGGVTAATPAQIRDAINKRTTKLKASLTEDNSLELKSTGETAKLTGDFTRLQVTAANEKLGFATPPAEAVVGTPAPRTSTGAQLSDVSTFKIGDAVRITDGTETTSVRLVTRSPLRGDVTWVPEVADIADFDPLTLRASRATFDLSIAYGGGEPNKVVETWADLSMDPEAPNYVESIINDQTAGSKYVTAIDLRSPGSANATDLPAPSTAFTPVTVQGRDGTPIASDFIGDAAARTGFFAFDPFDVQLLGCERTDREVTTAALGYCAGREDCMYFGAVPESFVESGEAIGYGQGFQARKVYGALYGPWIKVADPIGSNPVKSLPPVGHVMGVCARIATSHGIWKAPAGDEANILGALDVEYRLSDGEHTALVKEGSVNGIRAVPRSGIIVDASRTLSTDTRWLYVNVRLLFNYVKSSLKSGLRWARQEPNRYTLWDAIRIQTVTPFLMGLWRQGAFGTGTPEQVFTVICDASNNPPEQVDQGNLTVAVYFYPSKPAETIIIMVGQQPSGASVGEA